MKNYLRNLLVTLVAVIVIALIVGPLIASVIVSLYYGAIWWLLMLLYIPIVPLLVTGYQFLDDDD